MNRIKLVVTQATFYLVCTRVLYLIPVLLIITSLISKNKLIACGPYEPANQYTINYFDESIIGDNDFKICLLSNDPDYPIYERWEPSIQKRHSLNLKEWLRYFKNEVEIESLASVIYLSPLSSIEATQKALGDGSNLVDSLSKNNFLVYLKQQKKNEDLEYLHLAKRIEPHVSERSYWDNSKSDPNIKERLQIEAEKKAELTNNPFLKSRYAFQAIRLAHYSSNFEKAIELYGKYIGDIWKKEESERSIIDYKCLALKAGALHHTESRAEAMLNFAQLFAQTDFKQNLHKQNFEIAFWPDQFQDAVDLAKNNKEKSALYLLRETLEEREDIESLEKIYELDPSSDMLEALLVRKVGEIERNIVSPIITKQAELPKNLKQASLRYYEGSFSFSSIINGVRSFFKTIWDAILSFLGFGSSESNSEPINYEGLDFNSSDKGFLQQLLNFTATKGKEGKVKQPKIWLVVAAYLSQLTGESKKLNQLVSSQEPSNNKITEQANLILAMDALASKKSMSPQVEAKFYDALKNKVRDENIDYYYDFIPVADRIYVKLGQQYLLENRLGMAALCFNKADNDDTASALLDFVADIDQLKEIKAFFNETSHSPFEQLVLKNSNLDSDALSDIIATRLMRKGDYSSAISHFNSIPDKYWVEAFKEGDSMWGEDYLNFNVFTECNPDLNDCSGKIMNKKDFAQLVFELEKKAKSAENKSEAALNYYKLGNAFSSSPFWAYNAILWNGGLVTAFRGYGEYSPGNYPLNSLANATKVAESEIQFLKVYGTKRNAIEYYQKVIDLDPKGEMGAKAAYLAKLSQISPFACFQTPNFEDNSFVDLLKNQYNSTKFYSAIQESCPEMDKYLP